MALLVAVRALPKCNHRVHRERVDDGRDGIDPNRGDASRVLRMAGEHTCRKHDRKDETDTTHGVRLQN